MRGRLVMLNVPTKNAAKAKRFYGQLLGIDFAQSLVEKQTSFHAPGSAGVQVMINNRFSDSETVCAYFAVANLAEEIEQLKQVGGKVVVKPGKLPVHPAVHGTQAKMKISICAANVAASAKEALASELVPENLGQFALIRDPDNNLIGLIQLDPGAERFYQSHVRAEQLVEHNAAHQIAAKVGIAKG